MSLSGAPQYDLSSREESGDAGAGDADTAADDERGPSPYSSVCGTADVFHCCPTTQEVHEATLVLVFVDVPVERYIVVSVPQAVSRYVVVEVSHPIARRDGPSVSPQVIWPRKSLMGLLVPSNFVE